MFNYNPKQACKDIYKNNKIIALTSIYLFKLLTYIHKNKESFKKKLALTHIRLDIKIISFSNYFFKKNRYSCRTILLQYALSCIKNK